MLWCPSCLSEGLPDHVRFAVDRAVVSAFDLTNKDMDNLRKHGNNNGPMDLSRNGTLYIRYIHTLYTYVIYIRSLRWQKWAFNKIHQGGVFYLHIY